MFDDLINELNNLDGMEISVPLEVDEKGYIDKQCPSEDCEFKFKVNDEDWTNIFKDEVVWCPLCRHEAPADQWYTTEQVEHIEEEAFKITQGKIDRALKKNADNFNRKQKKSSFVNMSMEYKGPLGRTYAIPAEAADIMQLEIQCDECSVRFAVVGSAYFCPACGHNSVIQTFDDSLRKILAKKSSIDVVRAALNEAFDKDASELTCRSLIETCISDGVVAFQKFCEGMYEPFGKPPFNSFQRLEQGSSLWEKAISKTYGAWLNTSELEILNIIYQKRHILQHNEGIVDKQYISKSNDTNYKNGQRIVVSEGDVDFLYSCLQKLSQGIKEAVNNSSN
ncbi:MAG: hypothetical protein OCD01_09895 [Fibrobacterales bacterium]